MALEESSPAGADRGQAVEDQRGDALRGRPRPGWCLPPPQQARVQGRPVQHVPQDAQVNPVLDGACLGGRADQAAPQPVNAGRLGVDHGLEAGAGRGRRVEQADLQGRRMPERDRGDRLGVGPQGRQGVLGDRAELPDHADEIGVVRLDQLDRDRFLGLEVMVKTAGQDPRRRRDLAHRGVRVPVRREEPGGGGQDLVAPAHPGGQGRPGQWRGGRGHPALSRRPAPSRTWPRSLPRSDDAPAPVGDPA